MNYCECKPPLEIEEMSATLLVHKVCGKPLKVVPKQPKESWETRFDEEFGIGTIAPNIQDYMVDPLKSFIRTELAKARQEGRDMAVDYIKREYDKLFDPTNVPEGFNAAEWFEGILEAARSQESLPTKS